MGTMGRIPKRNGVPITRMLRQFALPVSNSSIKRVCFFSPYALVNQHCSGTSSWILRSAANGPFSIAMLRFKQGTSLLCAPLSSDSTTPPRWLERLHFCLLNFRQNFHHNIVKTGRCTAWESSWLSWALARTLCPLVRASDKRAGGKRTPSLQKECQERYLRRGQIPWI